MTRIGDTFRKLNESGTGAFIPYVCAGDPDKRFTVDLVEALSRAGADIVELGLPFSDPVADGPVIQRSMQRSLSGGFRTKDLFEIVSTLRSRGIVQPIVVMTYFNPVLKFGVSTFCGQFADSGADGLLVVDLPLEESSGLDSMARDNDLDVIRLVAPTTSDLRIDQILSQSSGFVYAVSVAGTTGAREVLPESAEALLKRVVRKSELPVALGFGISSPQQVRSALDAGASGVVVGSRIISEYSDGSGVRNDGLARVERFSGTLKAATRRTANR